MNTINTAPAKIRRGRTTAIIGMCAAGALLAAGGGIAITGAAFTDQKTITGNQIGAATLSIGDTLTGQVNVTNLLPGQSNDDSTLTFTNDGTVPFQYAISIDDVSTGSGLSASDRQQLLEWIPVTISTSAGTATGTLASPPVLQSSPTAPVTLNNGATATATVTVGLNENATNAAQGQSVDFDIVINAQQ